MDTLVPEAPEAPGWAALQCRVIPVSAPQVHFTMANLHLPVTCVRQCRGILQDKETRQGRSKLSNTMG